MVNWTELLILLSLRFGVPMLSAFLFSTNVTAFSPTAQSFKDQAGDFDVEQMRLSVTCTSGVSVIDDLLVWLLVDF